MKSMKRCASYADFEKEEYLRVKSFYENLEDIMDEELFSHYEEPFALKEAKKEDVIRDLEI